MNFQQAQRTFRATQRSRGFNGPNRFGKGFGKGGKGKKGKKGKSKGFPRFGKGDEDAMAAASSSSHPDALQDKSWWQDDDWNDDEGAYGAQHHVRCSDCGLLGHANAGGSKCPCHRAPSKGGGKRDASPRRFGKGGKGGGKGRGKYHRGPRPNRFAQRSLGFFGFLMGAFGQCCPWMTCCPGADSPAARQCP